MSWLALDIGGANLKAADGLGWACCVPFALWREPQNLPAALVKLIHAAPPAERLAITMTGELCDCFRTKVEGVRHILAAAEHAADGREVRVYLVDGRLVSINEAQAAPQLAAASNWHALARFACRFVGNAAGLLIDIGSTTTDIVPLIAGKPRPRGNDDTSRLLAGELVYTGVGRTPICAIVDSLPWRGNDCPVAAELFATTADAYVMLGKITERGNFAATADGRPLTKDFARARLARMICADATVVTFDDALRMAEAICDAQMHRVGRAIQVGVTGMTYPPECVVLSGEGVFLAEAAAKRILPAAQLVWLSKELGATASRAAPAHALVVLARSA